MTKILITGGAGFIASHACLVLLEAGHELVVFDNYVNSSPEACGAWWSWRGLGPRAASR
jgi:UDP-glucose 4-epimerase